jgi:hypothetical protein
MPAFTSKRQKLALILKLIQLTEDFQLAKGLAVNVIN